LQSRLKEIMKEQGRTQNWLSEKAGVSATSISSIVNKKSVPTLLIALRIAKALDKSVEEIWSED
jgi:putative transcriptional regulator